MGMTRNYKIVLLGDGKVGKTSLRRKFMGKHFQEDHLWTIGVDISIKRVTVDDDEIVLNIWDTGGQPNFQHVRSQYYLGAHGIVLVFDLINLETVKNLGKWIKEYQDGNPLNALKPPAVLLGNKNDLLPDQPNVESNELIDQNILQLSEMLDVDIVYLQTSALTGENVDASFNELVSQILDYNL